MHSTFQSEAQANDAKNSFIEFTPYSAARPVGLAGLLEFFHMAAVNYSRVCPQESFPLY